MKYRFGNRSRRNLEHVWEPLIRVGERALEMGVIDFGVPAKAARTQAEQDKLFDQGRTPESKARGEQIVTWTRNSNHIMKDGVCYAVDFVPYNGWYSWDEKDCLLMATCILKAAADLNIDIDWGYHLWGKDMPHFQKGGL